MSPVTLAADAEGSPLTPGLDLPGLSVTRWIEVAPFVLQAANGHERLAAAVTDGTPVRFSFGVMAPIAVFDRVPWHLSARWLLPGLVAALAALAVAVAQWPARALLRWRFGPLGGHGRRTADWYALRVSALVVLVAMAGWFGLITLFYSKPAVLSPGSDWVILSLKALTFAGLAALIASTAANAFAALRRSHGIV